MFKIVLISLVVFSFTNRAQANFAKILVLKGKASKLLPGQMKAKDIKKGESLPEYTSILTYDKSFLRIVFPDKSVVNLGANSKMIIAQKKNKDGTVINFLKGVMRTQVDKENNPNNENKMLIKTRTAVMGIRGTKFIASYNPVNKNTALVTVEGNVAIAKIDKKTEKNKAKQNMPDEKLLEQKLAVKEDVVEVKPGEFSGTTEETKEAFKVVKIAPEQFVALAESVKADIKEEEVYSEAKEENGADSGVKSGGFVDLQTGFYVPPSEEAKFDTKKGVFVASNDIGAVDTNGNYSAPEGVKLDPIKGFVAENKTSSDDKTASNDLNKNLKKKYDKVKAFNKDKKEEDKPWWISKYLPKNHLVKFDISSHMEKNDFTFYRVRHSVGPTVTRNKRKYEIKSEIGINYGVSFIQEWTNRFNTSFNFSVFRYEMRSEPREDFNERSKDYIGETNVQIGLHYAFNPRMQLSFLFGDARNYYPNVCFGCGPSVPPSFTYNEDNFEVLDQQTESIELAWQHYFMQKGNWSVGYILSYAQLGGHMDRYEIKNRGRYKIGLKTKKALSENLSIQPYLTVQLDYQKLVYYEYFTIGEYEDVSISQRRKSADLGAELTWDY